MSRPVQMIGITERGDPAFDTAWIQWVEAGKPAVLVTKDFPRVKAMAGLRKNVMYHATVTGLGGSSLEPGAPNPELVLDALNSVPKSYRPHVVVRIDPIIPTMHCVKDAIPIYNWAIANGFRVRISFMDYYPHVRARFEASENDDVRTLKETLDGVYGADLHAPLERRKRIHSTYFPEAVTCGEPGFDNVGCISKETCDILEVPFMEGTSGQRVTCACCGLKHELLSAPTKCGHRCLFCYHRITFC